ncbi:MAG: TonB-dependent receptor plug domain-containing protein, partial [Actinomycetota bacterium]
ALVLGTLSEPVAAQQTARGAVLEEIVVTTRKREENLLDVPLSISAFSAEEISRSGISSVSQLASQTVGFTYHQGFGRLGAGQGGSASNRPSIRGMANILGAPNAGFFVDGIYVSLFLAFNCFAIVQYLQYKKVGRFADYLVGEKTYLVLSLAAKSLLAWQIFASTLAATSVPN